MKNRIFLRDETVLEVLLLVRHVSKKICGKHSKIRPRGAIYNTKQTLAAKSRDLTLTTRNFVKKKKKKYNPRYIPHESSEIQAFFFLLY